ncbi:MAG: HK97 family phage prohead protease [Candidatus Marinimicrobia bacterium]|nr:HK97 family phage prohead protease [Candidatus Neomarinimicrobiota bacterium]
MPPDIAALTQAAERFQAEPSAAGNQNGDHELRMGGACELRMDGDDEHPTRTISGYAAVFNQPADIGYYTEEIAPGAFAESLRQDDVVALFNHDPNLLLGRSSGGTLRLVEDDRGLHYEFDVPDTQAGQDLVTSVERKDVIGSSFAFRTLDDEWSTKDGEPFRLITRAKLFDVSPVTYPAYRTTSVAARSLDRFIDEHRPTLEPWQMDLMRRRQLLAETQ